MKKTLLSLALLGTLVLAGCEEFEETASEADTRETMDIANKLVENQPTPKDIDYSLERYNLIKRAYWVNGQREKALSLPSAVDRPLGYIVLFGSSGATIGNFTVDGKVTSLNSFLTPDSEVYETTGDYGSSPVEHNGTSDNDWLADVDGSYGENDSGIFFFTTDAKYIEWTGDYLYSDIPFSVDEPILNIKGGN